MYKKILAPLDGSNLGECTLPHIKAIATGCQCPEVVLLTVLKPSELLSGSYISEGMNQQRMEEVTKMMEDADKQEKKRANDYLTKIAGKLNSSSLTVRTVVLDSEINKGAAEIILDYARDNKVDLIVMSTHGRSGISRWAFGSVTEKVIRHSTLPVLTITPAECRI